MWSHLNGENIISLFALPTVYEIQSQMIIYQFLLRLMENSTFFYMQSADYSEMLAQR